MQSESLVIAADVGGTNTKVALARFEAGKPFVLQRQVYASRNYATFELAIEAFLAHPQVASQAREIAGACFAVAGPVEEGRARLTNLTWQIDEAVLERHFRFHEVRVINDFAAAGLGIAHLDDGDLLTLQTGNPVARAQRVVIGAGTGLGVAVLDWDETGYEVLPSEAGHCDFAPADSQQDELLAYLRGSFSHVSCERVLSGPGLPRILAFLRQSGAGEPCAAFADALQHRPHAEVITEFALRRLDPLAVRALDIFVSAYGAFAGNMALATLAHGGLYVAGGIAPKIADKLKDGAFMRAFTAKGRFQQLLESIPVNVVMNHDVGLYGALGEAARVAQVR